MEATDWKPQAEAACDAVAEAIAPRLKTATDDLYSDLLYSVQTYLKENVLHNVQAEIEGANRQALHDRQRAIKAEANVAALVEALKGAQSVLAMMVEPGAIQQTTAINAYAAAKAAEAKARAAISQAEGGE